MSQRSEFSTSGSLARKAALAIKRSMSDESFNSLGDTFHEEEEEEEITGIEEDDAKFTHTSITARLKESANIDYSSRFKNENSRMVDDSFNELRESVTASRSRFTNELKSEFANDKYESKVAIDINIKLEAEISSLKTALNTSESTVARLQQEKKSFVEMQSYWEKMLNDLKDKQVVLREENSRITAQLNVKNNEYIKLSESNNALEFELRKEKLLNERLVRKETENKYEPRSPLVESICMKCVDYRRDLIFAEKKAHEAEEQLAQAINKLEIERKARMKDLEKNEMNVYDKIDKAVSLTLGYDPERIEVRRKEVFDRLTNLEKMTDVKIKKIAKENRILEEANSNLSNELKSRPSAREWRDMQIRLNSLINIVQEKERKGNNSLKEINTIDLIKRDRKISGLSPEILYNNINLLKSANLSSSFINSESERELLLATSLIIYEMCMALNINDVSNLSSFVSSMNEKAMMFDTIEEYTNNINEIIQNVWDEVHTLVEVPSNQINNKKEEKDSVIHNNTIRLKAILNDYRVIKSVKSDEETAHDILIEATKMVDAETLFEMIPNLKKMTFYIKEMNSFNNRLRKLFGLSSFSSASSLEKVINKYVSSLGLGAPRQWVCNRCTRTVDQISDLRDVGKEF